MKVPYISIKQCLVLCGLLLIAFPATAQQGSFGNTFIFSGTEMTVFGQHNFLAGGSGILSGIIGTERSDIPPFSIGSLSFSQNASWTGASDNEYVDGYVKTYQSGFFVFPIGDNGQFRPAAVSAASAASPAWCAFFGVDPGVAVTSSLKGGNEPVLPSGGPFDPAIKQNSLQLVSTSGYWDINATLQTAITLSWNALSNIAALTNGNLNKLTIAGWDGSQWIGIPSSPDPISLYGSPSTLTSGSISTSTVFAPNTFEVYTLAAWCDPLVLFNAGPDQSVCGGGFVTIGSPPIPGYVYSWSPSAGLSAPNAGISVFSGTSAGTQLFVLTTISPNNCVSTDEVEILVHPVLSRSVVTTDPTCFGAGNGTITVTITGGTPPYQISTDNGATYPYSSNSSPYIINNLGPGNYQVRVKDSNGCETVLCQ